MLNTRYRATPNSAITLNGYVIEKRFLYFFWLWVDFADTKEEAAKKIAHLTKEPLYYGGNRI